MRRRASRPPSATAFATAVLLAACQQSTPDHLPNADLQEAADAQQVRDAIQATPRQPGLPDRPCVGDGDDCAQAPRSQQVELAEQFQQALENAEDPTALQDAQRQWAARRLACRKAPDPAACVDEANRARIDELREIAANSAPVVEYRCQGSDLPFTAQFYQGDSPRAVFMLGGDRIEVPGAASASGARYTGNGVDYWEHQGEAKVDFEGTQLTCKPLA